MTLIDQAARAAARTTCLAPPADLDRTVAEIWIQRYSDAIRADRGTWRIVPDLQPHLIVHRSLDGRTRGPRVVGARSTWLDTRVDRRDWSVGLTLRPGALPAITRLSARDLADRSVGPTDVWGAKGSRLAERVAEAREPSEVLELLYGILRGMLPGSGTVVDWRVRGFAALAAGGPEGAGSPATGVGEIGRALGVSPRTLRQVWRREVGLSPREALSIERVHAAVRRALAGGRRASWSRIARAAGFYDQPHLIRDFRRLFGETPERFMARGRPGGR